MTKKRFLTASLFTWVVVFFQSAMVFSEGELKGPYDKFKTKDEAQKDDEKKKEEEKKKDSSIFKFYDKFLKNDKSSGSANTGSSSATTVIHEHYYYDYYGRPSYLPRKTYEVPVHENTSSSFSKIKDDILLAYRSQDADLLALYLSSDKKVFVEFPDEAPVYLAREEFYIRTRELFSDIQTKSVDVLLDREQDASGLVKLRHTYARANLTRTDDIAFFFVNSGGGWTLDQMRYSFPSAKHKITKKVARSLSIADMEAGTKSISFMMNNSKNIKHQYATLNFGVFDYGGAFVKFWQAEELWDETLPTQGVLRMTLTDIGLRGQFVKAEAHGFSLSMELLGKWLTFTPPPSVRNQYPRLQSFGLGIGFVGSLSAGKHLMAYGRVEPASFTKGVKVVQYEIGTGLHINKNISFLLSRRAIDFEEDVIRSSQGGIELHF